jgi:hypothetical protein
MDVTGPMMLSPLDQAFGGLAIVDAPSSMSPEEQQEFIRLEREINQGKMHLATLETSLANAVIDEEKARFDLAECVGAINERSRVLFGNGFDASKLLNSAEIYKKLCEGWTTPVRSSNPDVTNSVDLIVRVTSIKSSNPDLLSLEAALKNLIAKVTSIQERLSGLEGIALACNLKVSELVWRVPDPRFEFYTLKSSGKNRGNSPLSGGSLPSDSKSSV